MTDRHFFAELAALVAAAIVCAAVANAVAAKERKLAWAGDYPNARVVPAGASDPAPTPILTTPAGTTTPAGENAAMPTATATVTTDPTTPPNTAPPTTGPATAPARSAPAAAVATPSAPVVRPSDFQPHPDRAAVEISSAQARALHAAGVLFIDARRSQVYEQGHIPGSISMPVWESDIDDRVAAFLDAGHPQEAPIVIYCSGGACEDSHMLAQKLWGVGYNNALIYKDGWPDWLQHGGGTTKGPSR